MKATRHKITHHLQPTNSTCGYAALATLLSHYGKQYAPEELIGLVPQPEDADGKPQGSITAQLADWCQTQGLQVHMYVSDMYVFDLSWKDKDPLRIKERLEQVRSKRKVPILGEYWTEVYQDAYISMLSHGARLTVSQFITTDLLYRLLQKGPVYANICSSASSGKGRTVHTGLRTSVSDDVRGTLSNHSIVIYGNDAKGNFLVSDPWYGRRTIEPEHMVLAIEAAQIECDNLVFVIIRATQ